MPIRRLPFSLKHHCFSFRTSPPSVVNFKMSASNSRNLKRSLSDVSAEGQPEKYDVVGSGHVTSPRKPDLYAKPVTPPLRKCKAESLEWNTWNDDQANSQKREWQDYDHDAQSKWNPTTSDLDAALWRSIVGADSWINSSRDQEWYEWAETDPGIAMMDKFEAQLHREATEAADAFDRGISESRRVRKRPCHKGTETSMRLARKPYNT